MRKILTGLLLTSCVFFAASFDASAQLGWKLSASAEYETGTYGSGDRTDTWYLPVTLKRYLPEGEMSFTVPYIRQKSGPEVVNVGGTSVRTRKAAGPVATNSGLGDIILKGSYYVFKEDYKEGFDLSAVARIKLPTADEDKGLGTGEFDEGVGLEFAKQLGADWSVFIDAYYTLIGDPKGVDLKNRFSFDAGVAARLNATLTASVFYSQNSALLEDSTAQREISAALDYEAAKDIRLFGGASVGLTGTSQDYGINGGVSVRF
ncbi:MAG: transporter [Deltaproteobacteria bacterium]|nr:transporter [Deltaproteobacteria bacterium]